MCGLVKPSMSVEQVTIEQFQCRWGTSMVNCTPESQCRLQKITNNQKIDWSTIWFLGIIDTACINTLYMVDQLINDNSWLIIESPI